MGPKVQKSWSKIPTSKKRHIHGEILDIAVKKVDIQIRWVQKGYFLCPFLCFWVHQSPIQSKKHKSRSSVSKMPSKMLYILFFALISHRCLDCLCFGIFYYLASPSSGTMNALEGLLSIKEGVSGPPCPCIPQDARTEFRRCNAYLGTITPAKEVHINIWCSAIL